MNELSEQELLLLSNYAYFACSAGKGTIQENIDRLKNEDGTYDMEKVVAQGATGDIISEEDAVDILDRLQADDRLRNLSAARVINKGGIRATLYTDANDESPTLVFRGTGGSYKAWEDNVLGEYKSDTRLQKLAGDFVKYECGAYENITVTGHSKGGNLSQYVTVACASQVDRCVSFDGQGFSDSFINEYADEIAEAGSKITSISGYNDFVNILLTPIAGTVLYVRNQKGFSVDMHSCYTMLSNGIFDENGNFDRREGVVPQMLLMNFLKHTGDSLVSFIDMLPGDGNEKASNILSAMTAAVFSNNMGEEYENMKLEESVKEFGKYTGEVLGLAVRDENSVSYGCDYLFINIEDIKSAFWDIDRATERMAVFPELVEDIMSGIDITILGENYAKKALRKIKEKAERNYEKAKIFRDTLYSIINYYENADVV